MFTRESESEQQNVWVLQASAAGQQVFDGRHPALDDVTITGLEILPLEGDIPQSDLLNVS